VLIGELDLIIVVEKKRGINGKVRVPKFVRREFLQNLKAFGGASRVIKGKGISDCNFGIVRRLVVGMFCQLPALRGIAVEKKGKTRRVGLQTDFLRRALFEALRSETKIWQIVCRTIDLIKGIESFAPGG